MQKQKGVSTLLGIVIIVVAIVVLFGGVFAWQYFTTQKLDNLPQVQNQQISNTQPANQTAGWKTYKNDEYGFEFQYKPTWEITSQESSVNVCEGRAQGACYYDYITLGFVKDNPPVGGMFPKGCPSPAIIVSLTKKELVGKPNLTQPDLFSQTFVKVNGLDAEKLEAKQTKDIILYIDRNEKTFIFNLGCLNSTSNKQKYIDDFNDIISTFKFTTPTDQTAGWKTYTNSQYGFELKYPTSWVITNKYGGIINFLSQQHEDQNKKYIAMPSIVDLRVSYLNINELKSPIKDYLQTNFGNVTEISIAGKKAYATVVVAASANYIVYIESGESIYILSTPYSDEPPTINPQNQNIDETVKQILSTFKFTK